MSGQGGTLLLTDAQRPLRVEALEQPAERRSGDHGDATQDDRDRAHRAADFVESAGAASEGGDTDDGEDRAEQQPDCGHHRQAPDPPAASIRLCR